MALFMPAFLQTHQLNKDLTLTRALDGTASLTSSGSGERPCLPGYPRISLGRDCLIFLERELLTPELDILSPHLWLVATQRSNHVSTIHHQIVRGRNIIVTEDPKLHLVWVDNRIYIKPIPSYLLNHAFWVYAFSWQYSPFAEAARNSLCRSALGFLRTYAYLIEYESDLRLAKEHNLVPSSTTWTVWNAFVSPLYEALDTEVSARYHSGELRLTRLNFWSKIFLGRMDYFHVTGQTSAYLARVFAPLVFVWATCNVILAAMQVVVSIQAIYGHDNQGAWNAFAFTSRWFSIAILVVAALAILLVVMLVCGRFLKQLIYAASDKLRKQNKPQAEDNGDGKGKGSQEPRDRNSA